MDTEIAQPIDVLVVEKQGRMAVTTGGRADDTSGNIFVVFDSETPPADLDIFYTRVCGTCPARATQVVIGKDVREPRLVLNQDSWPGICCMPVERQVGLCLGMSEDHQEK